MGEVFLAGGLAGEVAGEAAGLPFFGWGWGKDGLGWRTGVLLLLFSLLLLPLFRGFILLVWRLLLIFLPSFPGCGWRRE